MSKKTWKDHLLASGLPLEHSVNEVLQSLGFLRPMEFRYERNNELGVPTEFSVDLIARKHLPAVDLDLELYIECKYRHDSTRWVFNPEEYDVWEGVVFRDTFVILDHTCASREINVPYLNGFKNMYPLCSKGVEIVNRSSNPNAIPRAFSQLGYAVPHAVVAAFNARGSQGSGDPITVIVPIIVTTAELWRIAPGTTVEAIRNSQEIQDVAANSEILLVNYPPNSDLSSYTFSLLTGKLTAGASTLLSKSGKVKNTKNFISSFASRVPAVFPVIRYTRFKESITNLLNFMTSSELFKVKANA